MTMDERKELMKLCKKLREQIKSFKANDRTKDMVEVKQIQRLLKQVEKFAK